MRPDNPFWIVWNPDRGLPKVTHESELLAMREAERLASLHPGEAFIVLESVCAKRCISVTTQDLRPSPF